MFAEGPVVVMVDLRPAAFGSFLRSGRGSTAFAVGGAAAGAIGPCAARRLLLRPILLWPIRCRPILFFFRLLRRTAPAAPAASVVVGQLGGFGLDRKSTRLNSSH